MSEETTPSTPPDRRARLREQTRREAKDIALEQLARTGPAGISVNAIAKAMGMTGPALYRYFASRDELLTALIADAYTGLAAALTRAAGGASGGATPGEGAQSVRGARLRGLAHAWRGWAKEHPERYLLIYGTPVPGYSAPEETRTIAAGMMRTTVSACEGLDPAETAEHRALRAWTRLHGLVGLEVAGHFDGMDFDVDQLFSDEVESLIR
ncbi:TetR/AcrR family transcriptional regulator [Streptomyces sp. NBC_01306]|uniref:TetR/AcrR family transcriptional regulator n=1 Tax=Streptomyces sp. NBC_01306 TaxID=2903819 RepID=UPI0022513CEF|nr:TetR/AcrR family transcriptional regulator [Streptomyces sp. NBC_01306]MCX4728348.1 TetR/AcrR family transcriptional regulator [Streptomyces sp. NBC_01306]